MQSTKPHPKLPAPNKHCHASICHSGNNTSKQWVRGGNTAPNNMILHEKQFQIHAEYNIGQTWEVCKYKPH